MSFIRQRLFSFLVVIGMGLLGIVAVLANLILAWFGSFLEKLLEIDVQPLVHYRYTRISPGHGNNRIVL